MTGPSNKAAQAVHLLAAISRLGLKAFSAKNRQALTFLILNDTLQVIHFNRSSLWNMQEKKPELLGFSGESAPNKSSKLVKNLASLIAKLEDPKQSQIFPHSVLEEIFGSKADFTNSIVWLPILSGNKLKLGLLLERWDGPKWQYDEIEILSFLMQNYGAAWDKFDQTRFSFDFIKKKKAALIFSGALLLALFVIRVPLRIVAPCEVVPEDPIMITAPLEGIIEEVKVDPGQMVKAGDTLFEYDKKVALEDVKLAQKQVYIIQAEIDRTIALARENKEKLSDLAVLQLRLKKEHNQLDLARYKAGQLTVTSPIDGVIVLEDPDEWRGNPVQIGEKVMMVSDPKQSKVRIWIPENDTIEFDPDSEVKVILNALPGKTFTAKLDYISAYVTMSDKNIPSFVAEANWVKTDDKNIKLGLKGTAILYGENVTLAYWLIRKPWSYIRRSTGI